MLVINFSRTHDTNHINAQNAGLIDAWILFLCKYSPIRAHANGHMISHIGQANNHINIHAMHHRFHRSVHQNFLVPSIGR